MDNSLKYLAQKTNFYNLFAKKGYAYFTKGDYNLNIIGVRNLLGGNIQNNTFNDAILCIYKENDVWKKQIWECTTDPGSTVMKKPSNKNGIAILYPKQYRSSFTFGLHKGKYECLIQSKNVKVYRDNNKNNKLDFNEKNTEEGMFGIHIHKAGSNSVQVNNWSEGCIVFKKESDFENFMSICHKSSALYGNKFTFTLITTNDLKV